MDEVFQTVRHDASVGRVNALQRRCMMTTPSKFMKATSFVKALVAAVCVAVVGFMFSAQLLLAEVEAPVKKSPGKEARLSQKDIISLIQNTLKHQRSTSSTDDPEYPFGECASIPDDSQEEPCFTILSGTWEPHQSGYLHTSKYASTDYYNKVIWVPDYESLQGTLKVSVVIPSLPPGDEFELPENVDYYILHSGIIDVVTVNQKENAGKVYELGEFDFDGTDAAILLDDASTPLGFYTIADAVCFGECPANLDITPPKIENVKTNAHNGLFYIEAKITDDASGVAGAFVYFNGQLYPMMGAGDIYSADIPYQPGINLNYYIIARDGAGNEAIWSPTRGYLTRGAGLRLGIPIGAFYKVKAQTHAKLDPARAGVERCGGPFCGDPVNTTTGNLFEQIRLVTLPGRPEIKLIISYNSQGGGLSIFGESWGYNYNSHITEMDNATFKGAFVQTPDGKTLKFTGSDFTPEPGIFDKLERSGDGFKLSQTDRTVLYFDHFGDMTRLEDVNGNGLNFTYAEQTEFINFSKIASIKADGGREISFEYNDKNLVSKISLPEGKILSFEYNETDDLTAITDGNGSRTAFEYQDHALIKKISPEGHAYYVNTYDGQRRVIKQVAGTTWTQEMTYGDNQTTVKDRYDRTILYSYDNSTGLMTAMHDESGKITRFEYNSNYQPIVETDPEGQRHEYGYDAQGNQTYQKDPLGQEVIRTFDAACNLPTYEKNQSGHETWWEYNSTCNLIKETNAAKVSRTFTYNSFGQLVAMSDFKGNATTFTYTAAGDVATITDALGQVSTRTYDNLGRLTGETNPRGQTYVYRYDQNDNLIEIAGPLGYRMQLVYDRNNRLIKRIDAKSNVTLLAYDASENLVAQTTPLGFRTHFVYGAMNEKLQMIDPEGRITQYAYTPTYQIAKIIAAAGTANAASTQTDYNGLRLPTRLTDAEGRVTLLEYDALYRVVKMVQDATGAKITTRYVYSPTGQIVTEFDANNNATQYELDALDRIVSKKDAEGYITRFEYDPNGNLVKKINPREYATIYVYDALNRLIKATDALNGVSTFAYDANGNLIDATNPNKITTHYVYDALDRMVTKIENFVPAGPAAASANVTTTYTYDLNDNVTKIVNPRGYATSMTYDADNRLVKISDALNNFIAFAYDQVNNRLSIRDRNGHVTAHRYDELNRLVERINAEQQKTRYAYDKVGNVLAVTNGRNYTTRFAYDGANRRIETMDALNKTERYTYDPAGNLTQQQDANGHATTYAYNRLNQLVKAVNPEKHAAAIAYDANGNPTTLTDRNGNVTQLSYDALDRLTVKQDALQGQWQYVYDPVGNVVTEIDANGHAASYAVDALNRVITVTDAEGKMTKVAYDPNGNRVSIIDGNNHATLLLYDEVDRTVAVIDAKQVKTTYRHDAEGNLTQKIEADNVTTRYDYNRIYQLMRVVQNARPNQGETQDVNVDTNYTYDAAGNLVMIENPNGAKTQFVFDPLNRQIKEIDALGQVWTFAYDAVGNRTQRIDAKLQTTRYAYYADNQLRQISYGAQIAVTYQYDPNNNRTGMVDTLGTTQWQFDPLNRVTAVTDALKRTLAMTYDPVGNRTGLTYPDGRTVQLAYYKNDWLKTLTDPDAGVISYARDGVGLTTLIANPNATTTTMRYDAVNQVEEIVNKGKKVNSRFVYQYDSLRQRTQVRAEYAWRTQNPVVTTYAYDPLRRLVASTDTEGVKNGYAYDRAGNRLRYETNDDGATNIPRDAVSQLYTYNQNNQLVTMAEQRKNQTTLFAYTYDANGNRVRKEFNGPPGPQVQGTQYKYDPENRLLAATNYQGNGQSNVILRDVTTMQYDGLGRRLVKTHDNKTGGGGLKRVEYAFDGLDPILDDEMWNPQYTNYYRGDGNRIALRQNFPTGTQGQKYWYHYDALGSTVGLTKQNGQSDHNYPYADYGMIEPQTGNFTAPHNAYTYTGQLWDDNLDVYEFYARAYDPQTGVWLQLDAYRGNLINPQSLHRYGYVKNSPVNVIDWYGFYSYEVHYELTYTLAYTEALKFMNPHESEKFASELAKVDQFFDGNIIQYIEHPLTLGDRGHMLPSTDAALQKVHEADSFFEFGSALHMVQDSYAHAAKGNNSLSEHFDVDYFKAFLRNSMLNIFLDEQCAEFWNDSMNDWQFLGYNTDTYTGYNQYDIEMRDMTQSLIFQYLASNYNQNQGIEYGDYKVYDSMTEQTKDILDAVKDAAVEGVVDIYEGGKLWLMSEFERIGEDYRIEPFKHIPMMIL